MSQINRGNFGFSHTPIITKGGTKWIVEALMRCQALIHKSPHNPVQYQVIYEPHPAPLPHTTQNDVPKC